MSMIFMRTSSSWPESKVEAASATISLIPAAGSAEAAAGGATGQKQRRPSSLPSSVPRRRGLEHQQEQRSLSFRGHDDDELRVVFKVEFLEWFRIHQDPTWKARQWSVKLFCFLLFFFCVSIKCRCRSWTMGTKISEFPASLVESWRW